MKNYIYILILIFNITTLKIFSSNEQSSTITLLMSPINPIGSDLLLAKEKINKLIEQPGKLARKLFKEKLKNKTNIGVYTAYNGMISRFINGKVVFPKQHSGDSITIIIIPKIHPVIIRGNTVDFFIKKKNTPIAIYMMKRNFNKENNIYYWNTSKIETINNKKIPTSAIKIFAKPKQINIPLGNTLAIKGNNLILPTIYPTTKLTANVNLLSLLKINKYFSPVKFITKKSNKRYARMIKP